MNNADLTQLIAAARTRQDAILTTKGPDYTRHEVDRLSNFKRAAGQLDLDPITVWAVYFGKHIDAIMTFVKTGHVESESIVGRIDDAQNYLCLLEALIVEAGAK